MGFLQRNYKAIHSLLSLQVQPHTPQVTLQSAVALMTLFSQLSSCLLFNLHIADIIVAALALQNICTKKFTSCSSKSHSCPASDSTAFKTAEEEV